MLENIAQQYDGFTPEYVDGNERYNTHARAVFYAVLEKDMRGKKLLDVACGYGYDLQEYGTRGATLHGIDASGEMVQAARQWAPNADVREGLMEDLPYEDGTFDIVVSKYALQTSGDVPQVIEEMSRVLRPGGTLAYLAVHPVRQFLEKKKNGKDYFTQEIVASTFFEGAVTAHEPSHTMQEYLNPEFLRQFRLLHIGEHADFPAAEQINGDTYPCFLVVRAEKL